MSLEREARKRRVIAFAGHMTDAPARRAPRFPERLVPAVRARVRDALSAHGRDILSICSAARGSDLIFLEEVLALGGGALVILPYSADRFKQTSVGQGWDAAFDRILGSPHVDVRFPLGAGGPAPALCASPFIACNQAIVVAAEQNAQTWGDPDPLLLAVCERLAGSRAGGTVDLIERWTSRGHRVQLIEL